MHAKPDWCALYAALINVLRCTRPSSCVISDKAWLHEASAQPRIDRGAGLGTRIHMSQEDIGVYVYESVLYNNVNEEHTFFHR